MKLLSHLKTVYHSSILARIFGKISKAYQGSFIFSINRGGDLDTALGQSSLIRDKKEESSKTGGIILPTFHRLAKGLTAISCREFALLLIFWAISFGSSAFIDGNRSTAILSWLSILLFVPFLFSTEAIVSVFCSSCIGRFFGFKPLMKSCACNRILLCLIGALGIIGSMFFSLPVALALPLLPVAFLMLFYLKPIGFICIILFSLPIFGTSVCIVLTILLILSHWIQRYLGEVKKQKISYIDIFFGVYIVLCVFSSLFSFAIADSLRVSLMWVILFSAAFIVVRNIKTASSLITALVFLLFGTVVACAVGLYQYLSGQINTTWTDTTLFENLSIRIYSTFANPNVFGEFLLLAIPVAAAVGLYTTKLRHKIASFVILGLSLITLALTYSRGCYVGIAVTVIVFLWMYNKKILAPLFIIGIPVGFAMLPQNIIDRILSMVNLADTSTSYRLKIYEGSFEVLKTYWPSGLGIGETAFNYVYPFFGIQGIVAPHTHSLFLQLMTSFGIAGLIYFAVLMFVYHRNIISTAHKFGRKSKERTLLTVFGAILSGFLIQSIFDYTWYNYRVYFLFWIIVALGFSAYRIFSRGELNND